MENKAVESFAGLNTSVANSDTDLHTKQQENDLTSENFISYLLFAGNFMASTTGMRILKPHETTT